MLLGADDELGRATYEDVHRLLTRALAPQMTDDEWRDAVADDWRDDLRGNGAMTLPLYIMSIFEVADLWTDSVEEWQYVVFINKLYRRVTKPRASKRRKKLWQAAGAVAMHARGSVVAQLLASSHSTLVRGKVCPHPHPPPRALVVHALRRRERRRNASAPTERNR